MASSDDMVEASISSLLVDSLKANQSGDDLSPEDVSWIDSCLVKDPDISDGDWTSMKGALLEILGLQPISVTSPHSATPTNDEFSGDIEMLHSAKPQNVKFSGRSDDDHVSTEIRDREMETVDDDFPVEEGAEYSLSQHSEGDLSGTLFRNAFLPHYREDSEAGGEVISLGNDIISSPTYETELFTQDIFKVWDLGIPAEEDDLSKQLNKVLSETSDKPVLPTINDSRVLKDLKEQSVNELITSLEDLSLSQQSD